MMEFLVLNLASWVCPAQFRAIGIWSFVGYIFGFYSEQVLFWTITVAARSKAWTIIACSNTGIVISNSTRGMDVWVRLFCVCVILCVGSGLATIWSPIQGVLPTVYRLRNWKAAKVHKGFRAVDRQTDRQTDTLEFLLWTARKSSIFLLNVACLTTIIF
jgi:hypothetical protein